MVNISPLIVLHQCQIVSNVSKKQEKKNKSQFHFCALFCSNI